MKKNNFILWVIGLIVCGCSSDNEVTEVPNDSSQNEETKTPTLTELQDQTLNVLTDNGNPKLWKISSASITNGTDVLDISNEFNVIDDEFIFSSGTSGNSLEWNRGHDINFNASKVEETLLDYYRSSLDSPFSFDAESSTNLTSGDFNIEVADDDSVEITYSGTGTAKGKGNANKEFDVQVNFQLLPKNQFDFQVPPNNLQFTSAFTLESGGVQTHSPGMIGSFSDNSFFFVTREEGYYYGNPDNPNFVRPERVVKFDLDDMSQSEFVDYSGENQDVVSKQLHIVNNQLVAIGGSKINTYDFDLSNQVTTDYTENLISEEYNTQIRFSRFGMAVQDDAAYIIGGALTHDGNQSQFMLEETKNIYKWDLNNQSLTFFAALPESRYGARGTIVDNKMYVIGGTQDFGVNAENPSDTIYIIDMNNPEDVQTLNLGTGLNASYVQKYENLIYITGNTIENITPSEEQFTQDTITFGNLKIWAFDTEDNSLTEIPHNLTNPNGGSAVHQMALFNGKMFILYGDLDESLGNEDNFGWPLQEWEIYSANIE